MFTDRSECHHAARACPSRDLFYVLAAILLIFVLREIVCWFFKTNHIGYQDDLAALGRRIDSIECRNNTGANCFV